MKNCRLIFFLSFLLTSTVGISQQYIDQVTTYDNTLYKGTIVEQKLGEHIKILILGSNDTVMLKMDEIDRIVKILKVENDRKVVIKKNTAKQPQFNTRRFSPEIALSIGGGDVAQMGLGFALFYRSHPKMQLGLSTTYFGELSSGNGRLYQWQKIPVLAEIQYDIQPYFKTRAALFVKLGIGYSFTLNGRYFDESVWSNVNITNGLAINPGIGCRFNVTHNTGIKLDISYQMILDRAQDDQKETLSQNVWNNILLRGSIFF
ncbi:MAG: hypothetical protein WAT79_14395 [Saprospiraceae bacterium]